MMMHTWQEVIRALLAFCSVQNLLRSFDMMASLLVLILLLHGSSALFVPGGKSNTRRPVIRGVVTMTTPIAIFTTNCLRTTDHPCLVHCQQSHPAAAPVLVLYTPKTSTATADEAAAVACLQRSLGPALHHVQSEPALAAFLEAQRRLDDAEVVYCPSGVEPHAAVVRSLEAVLGAGAGGSGAASSGTASLGALRCVPLADELFPYPGLEACSPYDLSFDPAQYAEAAVPFPPLWSPPTVTATAVTATAADGGGPVGGEVRALSLLVEYLTLGETAFTARYALEYAERFPTTRAHRRSIQRLLPGYVSRAAADMEKRPPGGSLENGEEGRGGVSGSDAVQVRVCSVVGRISPFFDAVCVAR